MVLALGYEDPVYSDLLRPGLVKGTLDNVESRQS